MSTRNWQVPITKVHEEKQIAYGPVLQPTTPEDTDSQGHFYSAEEIEKAAHRFMEKLHHGEASADGVMHVLRAGTDNVRLVESWIAPEDTTHGDQPVAKGTWLVGVKVANEKLWKMVKGGDLNAFSIGGRAQVT